MKVECKSGVVRRGAAALRIVSMSRKLSPVVLDAVSGGDFRVRPRAVGAKCSSTYVSIRATCPDSCTLKDQGCYAQTGFTNRVVRALDARAKVRGDRDRPMLDEAAAIDAAFPLGVPQDGGRDGCSGRDLRLHVSGDVTSEWGARILARAAERYQARGGGSVWTYTHRWREVPRGAWGPIRVLASVETLSDALDAARLGYAPAITVPKVPEESSGGKSARVTGNTALRRWRMVPCPYESRGVTCVQCRLCVDRDLAKLRVGIVFEFHGPGSGRKHRQLRLPQVR